jgi:hypothetical protein
MLGVKEHVSPTSHSLREVTTFEVHPDVHFPEEEMFLMCPTFVQRRKEAQRVESKPVNAEHRPDPKLDKYVLDMQPFAFASLSYVSDYKQQPFLRKDIMYHIYVDLLKIRVDDDNAEDVVRALEPDFFDAFQKENLDSLTLFRTIKNKYTNVWSMMQNNQFIAVSEVGNSHNCTMVSMHEMRTYNHQNAIEFKEFPTASAATDFNELLELVATKTYRAFWVPNNTTKISSVRNAIRFLEDRESEIPARVYGITSRYDKAYHVRNYVSMANIMQGRAYLLVQPDFYEHEWSIGDSVYALMHKEDDNPESTTQKYSIQYVHKEDLYKHRGDRDYAFFYIGLYINVSDHAYFKCCTVSLGPVVEQRLQLL